MRQGGLDYDGVILDSGKLKVSAAKQIYNLKRVSPSHLESSHIKISNKPISTDQYRTLQERVFNTPEFMGEARLVSGAREGIAKLLQANFGLKVITSRSGSGLDIARDFTLSQGIELPFIGVGYGISKAEAAAGLDFYTDDDLEKLLSLIGVVPHLFLFNTGKPQENLPDGIIQVRSWNELINGVMNRTEP